jgi:hypothetical protein
MTRTCALAAFLLLPLNAFAHPQLQNADKEPMLFTYVCTGLSGYIVPAPKWAAESDGMKDQQVLLKYRGDWKLAEATWTMGSAQPYYQAAGIGRSMRSGFSITVAADEYVETYIYNAGTTELLFTVTRSGSQLLPNSIKAFRGTCKPAGQLMN